MPENWRRLGVVAVVLLIGLAGWAGCSGEQVLGDEDRPPIVVYEGSLEFLHGHVWEDLGSRNWGPKHTNGRSVRKFIAFVINRSAQPAVCMAEGDSITIDYQLADKSIKSFSLTKKGNGQAGPPVLTAPTGMKGTPEQRRLRFEPQPSQGGVVWQVTAGTTCGPYQAGKTRILIDFDY